MARRMGHEGQVVIRIKVSASGDVDSANVTRSSGYAVLDETALATVRRWRFRPAQQGGHAVETTVNVPITFRLDKAG